MRVLVWIFIFLMADGLFAQSVFIPLNSDSYHYIERFDIKYPDYNKQIHTSVKPYKRRDVAAFVESLISDSSTCNLTDVDRFNIDYLLKDNNEWTKNSAAPSRRVILKPFYMFPADLYSVKTEDFMFKISPVIHFDMGREDGSNENKYFNTRGFEARGSINNKIGFYSFLTDNQAIMPEFINQKRAEHDGVLPGEGWNKNFKNNGIDFFSARGYITFNATKNIDVQFGQDKNFLGNGYRSIHLSDYANNYLFLKLNTNVWRINYQNLFKELLDYPERTGKSNMYKKKYATTHHLSIDLTDRLNIGFFENVVFSRGDSGMKDGFDFHYLNPIIFYRAVEHHLGDNDKVALGIDWKYNFLNALSFYGQVYIDEFNTSDLKMDLDTFLVRIGLRDQRQYATYASFRNKFGLQAGLKYIDIAGIDNLDGQLEYNVVRPYTYSHYDVSYTGQPSGQSYSHYRQPLAHPIGANFKEILAVIMYQPFYKVGFTAKWFSIVYGADSSGTNYGGNIFLDYEDRESDYSVLLCQGVLEKIQMADLMVTYRIKHNIFADLRYIYRYKTSEISTRNLRTSYVSIGLRMNFSGRKFDF
ncbi:MAG: hypothetical protein PHT69_03425 [Bacteroidales bacterium]|nr:hypothetical protein [Bacteroidales bacterium]